MMWEPEQVPYRRHAYGRHELCRTLSIVHPAGGMSIPRTSVTQRGSRTLSGAASVGFRSGRDRADMAVTLAHELAHAVTHDTCAGMPRDVREVVAESVAYAVCSRFGLDLSLRSVDDVADWLDDSEAFRVGMAANHDAPRP
jgi:hypothetical protein